MGELLKIINPKMSILLKILFKLLLLILSITSVITDCLPRSCASFGCCSGNCATWCDQCDIKYSC